MTEAEREIWKKNFPLWPDALIEKFSDCIHYELNKFDSIYGQDEKKFYDSIVSENSKQFTWDNITSQFYAGLSILSPTNQRYTKSQNFDFGAFWVYGSEIPDAIARDWVDHTEGSRTTNFIATGKIANFYYIPVSASVTYDSRLFSNVNVIFFIRYILTGGPYTKFFGSGLGTSSDYIWPGFPRFHLNFSSVSAPYNQVESLLALYENGKSLPYIDYQKLYEFFTYLSAYKNYGQQIQGSADVAIRTAQADIQNYRSDLESKLLSQKNDLENLQLNLTAQTQGQADSAKRDIQVLKVQAMGIKLQILGMLK